MNVTRRLSGLPLGLRKSASPLGASLAAFPPCILPSGCAWLPELLLDISRGWGPQGLCSWRTTSQLLWLFAYRLRNKSTLSKVRGEFMQALTRGSASRG